MSATWTNPTDRTQGDLISASDWNNLIGEDGSLDYANDRRGRKNYIINGNFDVWQRGTSFTSAGYSADRWRNNLNGGTIAISQGNFTIGQTDVPNNPNNYYDFDRTVANTGTNLFLEQRIENVRTLSSETATVSFWAKYTTNAPTSLNIRFVQNFGSGGSANVVTDLTTTQTITTSWVRYTYTATVPSISGKTVGAGSYLAIQFQNQNLEVFDIQIAQVQVEKGSVATDFEVLNRAEIRDLCFRYYYRYSYSDSTGGSFIGVGACNNTSYAFMTLFTPKEFRAQPTLSFSSASDFDIEPDDKVVTNITLTQPSLFIQSIRVYGTSLTQYRAAILYLDTSGGYLDLDAEL